MYYCNKCGHMGEDGPGHCKPTHYLGHLTACDYDAALVPDADQMPLQEVANVMARHLPDGWEVSLCMERGAAWVTLHNPEGDAVSLPDAADKSLTHQLSDALVMACGLTPNGQAQAPEARRADGRLERDVGRQREENNLA